MDKKIAEYMRRIDDERMNIFDSVLDLSSDYARLESMLDGDEVEEFIFSGPVTVAKWSDGTKTITRCQEGDTYDKQTGVLMCLVKRAYPNWHDILKKHCWEETC